MPRYRYYDKWQVSYQYDCHFSITTNTLADALWIAALKEDNCLVSGRADCEHEGIKAVASVSIHLKEARGLPITQVLELFDTRVDEYIASRTRTGQWGHKVV